MTAPLQNLQHATTDLSPELTFKRYAKCMLFGEHTVLRQGQALLTPVKSKYIEFAFQPTDQAFEFSNCDSSSFKINFQIDDLLDVACKLAQISKADIKGKLNCGFHMPLGCGLGASAVISTGIGHLLVQLGHIADEKIYHFACELENFFHGKSSGADVASVFYEKPILFKNRYDIDSFDFKQKPILMLSHSGSYGQTQFCIERVEALFRANTAKAETIDTNMKAATALAKAAFIADDFKTTNDLLTKALDLGHSCFEDWGLVNHKVSQHIHDLESLGAKAVKLTGAGDGGYVLSLWDQHPTSPTITFTPLFDDSI